MVGSYVRRTMFDVRYLKFDKSLTYRINNKTMKPFNQ
jgi:hypothetical protein